MKKYLKILRQCPLFYDIEDNELLGMLGCLDAKVETFDKKYTVFAEGKPASFIGILLSGMIQIIQIDYYGNRNIVSHAEPGDIFCEAFACAETKSLPVSVIAAEPSEIMLINCRHILHTCSNSCTHHQQLIFNLMRSLATKNIMFHQKLEITSKRSTREKLLTFLQFYSQKMGSNTFDIPYDRQELADYLEVERSGLSAEIGKLCREGIIESQRSRFTLL